VYLQLSCASGILRLHQQQQIKVWASFAKEQKSSVNNKEFFAAYMLMLTYLALRKAKWQPNTFHASAPTVCLRQEK